MTAVDRTARGDLVIVDLVRELCLETLDEVRESALAAETRELLERLDGPQRARAGLVGLHGVARGLAEIDPELGRWLERELERVEASVLAATRVRLLHLVLAGATQLSEAEVSDLACQWRHLSRSQRTRFVRTSGEASGAMQGERVSCTGQLPGRSQPFKTATCGPAGQAEFGPNLRAGLVVRRSRRGVAGHSRTEARCGSGLAPAPDLGENTSLDVVLVGHGLLPVQHRRHAGVGATEGRPPLVPGMPGKSAGENRPQRRPLARIRTVR